MTTMRAALAGTCALILAAACGPGGGTGALDPEQTQRLLAELPPPYNTADPLQGRQLFVLCSACHTLNPGGPHMVGPNLYEVLGAPAAAKEGFVYSDALKASGWTWDAERLDHWLSDPLKVLPGSKMVFIGLNDPAQRANLIAYLKVATSPAP